MPVTTWMISVKRVALPRVYAQLTLGILRRKTAVQFPRHPVRSSSQLPSLDAMSRFLEEELSLFDLRLESVQRSWRWPRDDVTVPAEDTVVARTEEAVLFIDPANAAPEVGADVGEHRELRAVLGGHEHRDPLLLHEVAVAANDSGLHERRRRTGFDRRHQSEPDPGLFPGRGACQPRHENHARNSDGDCDGAPDGGDTPNQEGATGRFGHIKGPEGSGRVLKSFRRISVFLHPRPPSSILDLELLPGELGPVLF